MKFDDMVGQGLKVTPPIAARLAGRAMPLGRTGNHRVWLRAWLERLPPPLAKSLLLVWVVARARVCARPVALPLA